VTDGWTDGQNYDSQDRASIAVSRGNKAEVSNYRPVSLTNVVCKVMESIIRDHVMKHFLKNDLFSIRQYGFLKGTVITHHR